jgi:hypothetical protein
VHIDPGTGAVTFPNGVAIDASLTQDAFRASAIFAQARADTVGVPPWIHYHFSGGHLEGKELLVSLLYYDQMLVSVNVAADLYPPGPKDWSNYSLDVEAATKDFHDRLLTRLLGSPTESPEMSSGGFSAAQATLARPHRWRLPWGSVWSGHDTKGGGTSVMVQYGNRNEEANRLFRERRRTP